MTWNQDRERIIAAAELGDAPAKTAVALLVDARKRAYDAVRESEAQKTAAIRLREDLVERTSERDAAREEVKTLRHNLMAITAQEQERTEQLAMAEAACRRDATALGEVQAELAVLKAAHAWIKPTDRLPADDARVLALVVDVNGAELIEIVNFIACVPQWRFDYGNELIDDEIVVGWMPLPGRAR